ncbi:MAG: EF-hand domain-containing protein [Sulfurimonas sp.]|nr:EF-hand domain-containing protein [Sulfurimonas sp.]
MTVSSNYSSYASYGSSATQMAKPNFEEMAKELLNSIDSDASGSVDLTEFTTAMQSSSSSSDSTLSDIFSKIDSNSDGAMSSEELMAALEASKPQKPQGNGEMMGSMPPPPPPPPSSSEESSDESSISDVFSALDTNKDGTISQDELLALLGDETSDTSSSSQEQSQTRDLKDKMLQNILAYYSSNELTTSSSSLSLSA